MSVTIDIVPLSTTIDMCGEPDINSAYAVAGHVELTIKPRTFSFFGPYRTRLLLRSLTFTFEGQCEVINPKSGYKATRLCTVNHELIDSWQELYNDGEEETRWDVTYNVPIPGWLPATSLLGYDNDGGVQYFAYATAEFTSLDDGDSPFWKMCAPFRSQVWTVDTRKNITLRRLVIPTTASNSFPESHFLVGTDVAIQNEGELPDVPSFPSHILKQVQVLASVPGYCNVDAADTSIPLTLRLRVKDLNLEEAASFEISHMLVDVLQAQRCKHRTSREYASQFPLPSEEHQPPIEPLRHPHPISAMFELGFYNLPNLEGPTHRTISLIPEENAGRFDLPENTKPFINENGGMRDGWYAVNVSVPYTKEFGRKVSVADWAGEEALRPSQVTPLFTIRHELKISLHCSYRSSNGLAVRRVAFAVPLRFGHFVQPSIPTTPDVDQSSDDEDDDGDANTPLLSRSRPYAQPLLPAYSTLYDSRGRRKVDYTDFLPVYSPEAQ